MDKTFAYIPHSVLRFTVNTDGPVRIQGSGDPAPRMDLELPMAEPYARLMGRWIIECTKNTILMRETASRAEEEDDHIRLLFQSPGAGVETEHSSQTGRVTSKFERVDRIDVYPHVAGWFKVQLREPAAGGGTAAEAGNGPAQNAAGPVFSAAERTSLEDRIHQLEKELAREQAYTKSLQDIIGNHLDDALHLQDEEKASLTSENQKKQEKLVSQDKELEELKRDIGKLQKDIEDAPATIQAQKDELTGLQEQLRELEEQREAIELDCDEAKKQVEELKAHVDLDAETAALLEKGERLKHGTISKTLAEMDSEIEKVEKRIAFILKFRSEFNQIVENTILSGDGTISADEEAGGIADGNGSTASEEDQ